MPEHSLHEIARRCYDAALRASHPTQPTFHAMQSCTFEKGRSYLISVGKAATAMTDGAQQWATENGGEFEAGIVISHELARRGTERFQYHTGNHPLPGEDSLRASEALAAFIRRLPVDATVHVLISGGTTALIGAPISGLMLAELRSLFEHLLHSGLAIDEMNAIRKRCTRWGAGRLAEALAPRRVHAWLLSDVPGDDLATIGSGPCSPDEWTSARVITLLETIGILGELPAVAQECLARETPKVRAPAFEHVSLTLVGGNDLAIGGIRAAAASLGCSQRPFLTPLAGEAADTGQKLATEAMRIAKEWQEQSELLIEEGNPSWVRPLVLYQGGETTVTISGTPGHGGRSQELALSAARMLEISAWPLVFLAGSTDGRDGTANVAGAVIDQSTWESIQAGGVDPANALRTHDSHPALQSVNALITTGATGGNVSDIVIAVVGRSVASE